MNNQTEDIYITLPKDSTLYLYTRQGLLEINHVKTKIQKDIALVIQLCLQGFSLYRAIEHFLRIITSKVKQGKSYYWEYQL